MPTAPQPSATAQITVLPVQSVHPNDYNPNRMTEAEFSGLVSEVRQLGRLPKPIVVRPDGDGYVIVDGEHGWRAAYAAGLVEIPCEVIDVDDFEAMRQTYTRNQHGTHNPVHLGRMFRRMLLDRGLSQRTLAAETELSEGTIRNALAYAEAADLRNRYAGAPDVASQRGRRAKAGMVAPSPDDDVARLSIRQVREYLKLPPPIGDVWLSAGADLKLLADAGRVVVTDAVNGRRSPMKRAVRFYDPDGGRRVSDEHHVEPWQALIDAGLHHRLDPGRFVESARRAFQFLDWLRQYGRYIHADAYVRVVHDAGLGLEWLDRLPCTASGGEVRPAVSVECWAQIIEQVAARMDTDKEGQEILQAGLALALRRTELTTADMTDPRVGQLLALLQDGPSCIREAAIPLRQQAELLFARPPYRAPEAAVLEAQRRAVRLLEDQHAYVSSLGALSPLERLEAATAGYQQAKAGTGRWRGTAEQAFAQSLDAVMREHRQGELGLRFADPGLLMSTVVGKLRQQYDLTDATVRTLVVRLEDLPRPEWLFLASLVLDDGRQAMKRYLAALRVDTPEDGKSESLG